MFRDSLLDGETIIVTGGGTGLGKSMALRFAELGANLAITSRKREVIEGAAEEMRAKGARAIAVPCDVRKPDEVEAVVEATIKEFGQVTGLINNAAGNFLCPTELLSYNGFSAVVGIVLNGTFNFTLATGRKFIEQGKGGKILNITTTYAWTGSAFVVPSASAKAGVLAMTRSLAVEWGKYHIRVNAIAPGPFPTEGAWNALMVPGIEEKAKSRIPARRFGEHIELANLATYLMANESDYITGECVTIDGGEWFMGGEFNELAALSPEEWEALNAARQNQA